MKWTDESPDSALAPVPADLLRQRPVRVLNRGLESASALGAGDFSDGDPGVAARCRLLIREHVHSQVLVHLRSRRVEQGGLLIGAAYCAGPDCAAPVRIIVTDSVPAEQATGTGYSLRMEAAVWSAAREKLDGARHDAPAPADPNRAIPAPADLRIVGWYHSHPGLSAFFSATDRATQAAFFNHAYSIGWVIDPTDDSHAGYLGAHSEELACLLVA